MSIKAEQKSEIGEKFENLVKNNSEYNWKIERLMQDKPRNTGQT